MKKFGLLLIVVASVLVVSVANASSTDFRVDDDGADCPNADFTSIQAAVNAAGPGDKVTVCPGTYNEQVTIGAGKDGLRVESQKPLEAVIKAPAVMTEPGDVVRINTAQDVKLKGFTIAGPLPDALFCSLISGPGCG